MQVQRYDTGTLSVIREDNGFLTAQVNLARVGVFPYLKSDGDIVFEAKLPEELFSQSTIDSAKGIPVTLGHPEEGLVTPENARKHVVGSIGQDVHEAEGFLKGTEIVYAKELIDDLKVGDSVEVSIGFLADVEETSGEFQGQRFDAIQRRMKINHLAHVDKGRGGESVRVFLNDQNIDFAVMQDVKNTKKTKRRDSKVNHPQTKTYRSSDGKDYQLPVPVFDEIMSMRKDIQNLPEVMRQLDGLKSELANYTSSGNMQQDRQALATVSAELDATKQIVSDLQAQLSEVTSPQNLDAAIDDRMQLIEVAKAAIPDFNSDGLSNREIQMKVIDTVLPNKDINLKDEEDFVIKARYDAAAQVLRERAKVHSKKQLTYKGKAVTHDSIEEKKNKRLNMMEVSK